jgi:hypothetical protein
VDVVGALTWEPVRSVWPRLEGDTHLGYWLSAIGYLRNLV